MNESFPPGNRGERIRLQADHARERLRHRYDQLWSNGIAKIRTGEIQIDRILANRLPDRRRGLTLIARPSPAVRERVAVFLDKLRALEPDQYFYARSELHVTVLRNFSLDRNDWYMSRLVLQTIRRYGLPRPGRRG